MDNRVYWMWLVTVFGAANPRLWQLGERYETAEEYVYALRSNMISGLSDGEIKKIGSTSFEQAKEIISRCEENNIKVYCYESEGFPEHLKRIANPPAILFCRGNLDFLNNKITAAVIGTRSPSEYSEKVTDMLCTELCSRGCVIVTGIADGIDQLANSAAIRSGNPTCGVCGREIDGGYPVGSDEMKNRIAEQGAIVSETCSFMKSPPLSFTKRNRILVGLSDAVIFVECSSASKGLDNADHAIAQGKQIFVVPPHDIFDKRYSGQSELIRKGCKVYLGSEDFVYYLSSVRIEDFSFDRIGGKYSTVDDSSMFEHEKKKSSPKKKRVRQSAENKEKEAESEKNVLSKTAADYSALSDVQADICRLLEKKPMLADSIAAALQRDIGEILTELTTLELDGIIRSLPGKMFGM